MEVPEKKYPVDAKDYKLYEEIGEGVSAIVYRALCIPFNEVVAIKVLDLERCSNDLDGIRREVHTMSLIDNPNALRSHCSFTDRHHLWLVMPYMAGGSCLHIMKFSYPEGFDESVIATLLRETLKALVYLHAHGHIHRDVKAGNILLDSNGAVKLADFGVSACMFDSGDRQRSRNTFVGTPCWMAPEVMQQLHGYDFKADIWSLGITALELAHGHAPFSKYPPMKVLLMTLQNAPPGLDYERDKRFSKSFKELVSACLVKDPKKRPTSEKLLKHHFFKQAKSSDYLARSILDGLPPLGERFRILKAKEAELLVQNKALYGDKDQLSQQEYIRGISAWDFNLEDLKNQAALIQDDDGSSTMKIPEEDVKEKNPSDDYTSPTEKRSPERANNSNTSDSHEDGVDDLDTLEDSLASFPIQPLQALKGCFDVGEDVITNANWKNVAETNTDSQTPISESKQVGRTESDNLVRSSSVPQFGMTGQKKGVSGPLLHEHIGYPKKNCGDGDRYPCDRNYSGPILLRQKRETNNQTSVDDSSEGAVFQRKGRFQVTSADMYSKGSTSGYLNPFPGSAGAPLPPSSAASAILPSLQCILQHNNVQRDEIVRLIKLVEQGNLSDLGDSATNGAPQIQPLSSREVELLAQVSQLQQRVGSLVEELQRQKLKNAQFEGRLNTSAKKNEKAII